MARVSYPGMQSSMGRRRQRRPRHNFQLRWRPWQLQPFMIAPVLPGETLNNALLQCRAVSDPIRNPLVGWWLEHYLFYVAYHQLGTSMADEFEGVMLNQPDADPFGLFDGSTNAAYYVKVGGVEWMSNALSQIQKHWFMHQEERDETKTIDSIPQCAINTPGWWNNIILDSELSAVDVDILDEAGFTATVDTSDAGQSDDPVTVTDTLTASELEAAMRDYELAKMQNLVDMTFEEWVSTYGVSVPKDSRNDAPMLLRYSRSWQYPSNTIDPSDGSPVSAVSWVVQERADKKRFFRWPGFIIGVSVARPKVYLNTLETSGASLMKTPGSWMAPQLRQDPTSALVSVASSLQGMGAAASVDMHDLYMHGDQFVNFDLSAETDGNGVSLPDSTGRARWADLTDAKKLFVDESNDVLTRIRCDGVCALNISTTLGDPTPGVSQHP